MGDCHALINQKWTLNSKKEIETSNGMCLEVAHNTANGVRLWQCNGNINQRWTYSNKQLTDREGKCLSINARGNDLRRYDSKLELKACDNTPKQGWLFDPPLMPENNPNELTKLSYTGVSFINGAGNCLDVHYDDYLRNKNGAKVQLWTCNGQQNQKRTYSNNKLRSINGKCLAVYSGTLRKNCSRVQLWDCNSRVLQDWVLASDFTPLISNDGSLCLDVHAPDYRENGGKVQIWGCNNQTQQKWRFTGEESLMNAGGKCLDVDLGDYKSRINSARIQIWKCNGKKNQKWRRKGKQIKSSNGLCLDVSASQLLQNGGKVQLWQCNNSAQQSW